MSETTKKVSKKERAKKRNMRNTVIMAILCVALLSSATYAWFTLSNSAKVSNLSLTVGGAGGLMISYKNDGEFSNELVLPDMGGKKLIPATIGTWNDTLDLYKPTSEDVTDLTPVLAEDKIIYNFASSSYDNDPSNAYCYEQVFYLKIADTQTYNIKLNASNLTSNPVKGSTAGTWMVENNNDTLTKSQTSDLNGVDVLRIAFYTYEGENPVLEAIYEPNADATPEVGAGTYIASPGGYTKWTTNVVKQSVTGKFGDGVAYNDNTSNTLFQMTGGTEPTKVLMKVYFDGDDAQCANGIALEKIAGQIEFASEVATP